MMVVGNQAGGVFPSLAQATSKQSAMPCGQGCGKRYKVGEDVGHVNHPLGSAGAEPMVRTGDGVSEA